MIRQNRLRELRAARGWSQERVAVLTGQSHAAVNRHENGNRGLTPDVMRRYAELFEVDTVELYVEQLPKGE
jgi:transcriptional regulator with XRE-family HTH domain